MRQNFRILLIDDSAAIRRLLCCILTEAEFEVVAVDGVRAALRQLRTFTPNVVLTDFNMPGLNGEALVRLLRRDPRFSVTPILVVCSETSVEPRQGMAAAGANAWLGKPVDARALVRAVQALCASEPAAAVQDPSYRARHAPAHLQAQL